jgi:hypothetical protein
MLLQAIIFRYFLGDHFRYFLGHIFCQQLWIFYYNVSQYFKLLFLIIDIYEGKYIK